MYKITFYEEICCEDCNEVIHNHFTCPICKEKYAGTTLYSKVELEYDKDFECEECGAKFKYDEERELWQSLEN